MAAAMLGRFDLKSMRGHQWLQAHMFEVSFLSKLSGGSLGYTFDHVLDSKKGNMEIVSLGQRVADNTNVNRMTDVILAQPGGTNTVEFKGLGSQILLTCLQ
jgi:hypothetical protein